MSKTYIFRWQTRRPDRLWGKVTVQNIDDLQDARDLACNHLVACVKDLRRGDIEFIAVEARVRCGGCQELTDPETCHCGDPLEAHSIWAGHSPVPMGCQCGRSDAP